MVKFSTFKIKPLFLKLDGIKLKIQIEIRFKVSMINELGNFHDQAVILNNEKEAKSNLQILNPQSKVLESKWVYK